jgi:tRNA(Ile)-lysidine synthetase-like protein
VTKEHPRTCIVAVSGGVDSSVLLHMLVHDPVHLNLHCDTFVVAHVNHGIRQSTSNRDHRFVNKMAEEYGLTFESAELKLGEDTSEETARDARYKALNAIARKYHTTRIVLAHHADDVLETAIINILRGTGHRGLIALSSGDHKIRPLLHMSKDEIQNYAKKHNVKWVSDESNEDQNYLRNYVRHSILCKATPEWKQEFAKQLQKIKAPSHQLDREIATILQYRLKGKAVVSRSWFVKLPHNVSCEIMRSVLVKLSISNIDSGLIERLVISLKAGRIGSAIDIDKLHYAIITKRSMRIMARKTGKTCRV